jgi:ribose transport system permease protein
MRLRQHARWPAPEPVAEYVGMLGVLGLLLLLFGLLSEHFLTALTLSTLANQVPPLTVVAVGMTYVLVVAGIDLSVGSVLALGGAVLGVVVVDWQWPLGAGILLSLLAGLGCGLINGFVSVRWRLPSFIVTLGMLEAARGGAYLATGSRSLFIGARVEAIGSPLPGVGLSPAFFLALAVVLIGQVVLTRTVFGRHAIAIGTNEEAVRLSGIDPRPVKVAIFCLAGLLAGLGGVLQVAHLQSADPNAGVGMELSAIAAVVIGGTSLMGGRGSVRNSFLGVLIIAVLQMGLAQVGASEPVKRVITGGVIVVAVVLDVYRHRLTRFRSASI